MDANLLPVGWRTKLVLCTDCGHLFELFADEWTDPSRVACDRCDGQQTVAINQDALDELPPIKLIFS